MRPRVKDQLAEFGCTATADEFRTALIEAKNEAFPDWGIEDLTYTKNQAADYCALVRRKLNAPKLPRVFILRNLVSCRKNGLLKPRPVSAGAPLAAMASSPDGQTAE